MTKNSKKMDKGNQPRARKKIMVIIRWPVSKEKETLKCEKILA